MADRNPDKFDPTRTLAMTRGAQLNGHALARLATVRVVEEPTDRPGEVTDELARRLWAAGTLDYADEMVATEVEDPKTGLANLVETDELGGGWFQLRAPWHDGAVKVQGEANIADARDDLIAEGMAGLDLRRPPETQLFRIEEAGSNGWFLVHGPGLNEPLKIRGEQNAMAKRDELENAAKAPPAGAATNVTSLPPPPPADGADRTTAGEQDGDAAETDGDD